MVQVDVFWSYGIGAGLGLASAPGTGSRLRDLVKEGPAFHALLFLAVVLAPAGFVSLWSNPSWQTMHAGTRDLPAWLVALFGVTNITQGLLGFWAARWLYARDRPFAAYLQWVLGYFLFYFILVHGWDGTGYQRFFSTTRESLEAWTWATARTWLTSDVAVLLLIMLAVMVPWILGLTVPWLRAGARGRGLEPSRPTVLSLSILGLLLVALPVLAVVSSLMVRWLGVAGGALGTVALFAVLCSRRFGALRRHFETLGFTARQASAMTMRTGRHVGATGEDHG
jgi:hypothetical protein